MSTPKEMIEDIKKLFKEHGFEFKTKTNEGFLVFEKKGKLFIQKQEPDSRYIILKKKINNFGV